MWLPLTPPHRSWNCSWTEERQGLPSDPVEPRLFIWQPGQPTGGRENPVESGSDPRSAMEKETLPRSSNESIARIFGDFQPPEPPGIRFSAIPGIEELPSRSEGEAWPRLISSLRGFSTMRHRRKVMKKKVLMGVVSLALLGVGGSVYAYGGGGECAAKREADARQGGAGPG